MSVHAKFLPMFCVPYLKFSKLCKLDCSAEESEPRQCSEYGGGCSSAFCNRNSLIVFPVLGSVKPQLVPQSAGKCFFARSPRRAINDLHFRRFIGGHRPRERDFAIPENTSSTISADLRKLITFGPPCACE